MGLAASFAAIVFLLFSKAARRLAKVSSDGNTVVFLRLLGGKSVDFLRFLRFLRSLTMGSRTWLLFLMLPLVAARREGKGLFDGPDAVAAG